jgi:hypothetical protein
MMDCYVARCLRGARMIGSNRRMIGHDRHRVALDPALTSFS